MTKDGTTLQVRVGERNKMYDEAQDRIKAAKRGEEVEERNVLNLESLADLTRLVSETNLEVLRAIKQNEPKSMRQVEELVNRDHKEVHRNLKELEAMGIIDFVKEGRAKRPVVRFDTLEIDIPMSDSHSKGETALV